MQAQLNGITVEYEVSGPDSGHWVVLSNSLMTTLRMWDYQLPVLHRYRVLRYDQRGHGGTEGTKGPYDFELLAKDAIALMDHVGANQVHWVGLSMGGMIGQALALYYPERIRSLTLCDTVGHSLGDRKAKRAERIKRVEVDGVEPMVEGCLTGFFSQDFAETNPELMDQMRDVIRNTSVNGVIGCSHALNDHDYTPRLHEIHHPALVIVGEHDPSTPEADSREMADQIPFADFVILPHAKHLSNIERAFEFNATLMAFLDEVDEVEDPYVEP